MIPGGGTEPIQILLSLSQRRHSRRPPPPLGQIVDVLFHHSFAVAPPRRASTKAKRAKGLQIRGWHLGRRSGTDLSGLAEDINPQVRGWINYYRRFYRSELYFLARGIDEHLVRWAMQKFKRLRHKPTRAWDWLAQVRQRQPNLFAHWRLGQLAPGRTVGAV